MNTRCGQFSPQVITPQIIFGLVKCFSKNLGLDLQRKPGMITTGNMVALRASFAALAFFGSSQLFEVAMQFFDLPAHVVRFLSGLRGQRLIRAIGNDPVNAAIFGN